MTLTLPGLYSAGGPGWYLAAALQTLAAEVAATHPAVSCLGTIGNAAHGTEGDSSDHNPFIRAPDGRGVVRAIDLAGPAPDLDAIEAQVLRLYRNGDPRMFQFGYFHRDNVISNWPPLPVGGTHVDLGDVGHLHISVTQRNGNAPSSSGYLPSIDSTAGWGIAQTPVGPPAPSGPVQPYGKATRMLIVHDTTDTAVYLQSDDGVLHHLLTEADVDAYVAAGLTTAYPTHAFIQSLPGAWRPAPAV